MNEDDPLNAWGYVRLSQSGREGSIEDQKAAVREYARGAPGLQLVTTLNEGDKTSGFNADREKYTRLLQKIEDGNVGAVVVRDRARLSRDFDERLRLLTLFRESRTELHVIEAGGFINVDNVQTAAMECVHAAMDHAKKMAEIRRSKEAVEERQEQGYYQGKPPYGLAFDDDGRYLVPGEEFDTVLEVLERADAGDSYRDIERKTGVPKSTVGRILDRREKYEEVRERSETKEHTA